MVNLLGLVIGDALARRADVPTEERRRLSLLGAAPNSPLTGAVLVSAALNRGRRPPRRAGAEGGAEGGGLLRRGEFGGARPAATGAAEQTVDDARRATDPLRAEYERYREEVVEGGGGEVDDRAGRGEFGGARPAARGAAEEILDDVRRATDRLEAALRRDEDVEESFRQLERAVTATAGLRPGQGGDAE
jgi:hypothetical protein